MTTAYNRYLEIRMPESGINFGGAQYISNGKIIKPLKITASCSMTTESTPNDAEVTIYNLSEQSAKNLFQSGKTLEIWAGYAPNQEEQSIGMMFSGKIKNISSDVKGVDRVWVIAISDGGDAYKAASVVAKSDGGNLKKCAELAAAAMAEQYGVEVGVIKLGKEVSTGKTITYNGDYARDVLDDVCASTDSKWQITNGKLNVTPKREALKKTGLVLTPQTGLIGHPKITDDGVEFDTIVIPNVYPNMSVVVNARYGAGTYQINQIEMSLTNADGDHKFSMRNKVASDGAKTDTATRTNNVRC